MVISPEKSAVVVLFINIFKFVRFYLVLYLADFSGDIMFCERDLVRERDLVHLKPSIASLLLRCKRRVPGTPSVPSLRSSRDNVAHCFVSLALQAACAWGAVGPFASLVT